jgi:hypothetical protein
MNKLEAETIEKFLRFCKFAIIALLVAGGMLNSNTLLGLV